MSGAMQLKTDFDDATAESPLEAAARKITEARIVIAKILKENHVHGHFTMLGRRRAQAPALIAFTPCDFTPEQVRQIFAGNLPPEKQPNCALSHCIVVTDEDDRARPNSVVFNSSPDRLLEFLKARQEPENRPSLTLV